MRKSPSLFALLAVMLLPFTAFADQSDQVDCASTCDEGKRLISYADGNNTTCVCVEEATMDATVADPDVDPDAVNTDD